MKSCRPQHWCILSFLHFVCHKNVTCCEIYNIPWFYHKKIFFKNFSPGKLCTLCKKKNSSVGWKVSISVFGTQTLFERNSGCDFEFYTKNSSKAQLFRHMNFCFGCITQQSTEFCLARKSIKKFSCAETTGYCKFHNNWRSEDTQSAAMT